MGISSISNTNVFLVFSKEEMLDLKYIEIGDICIIKDAISEIMYVRNANNSWEKVISPNRRSNLIYNKPNSKTRKPHWGDFIEVSKRK